MPRNMTLNDNDCIAQSYEASDMQIDWIHRVSHTSDHSILNMDGQQFERLSTNAR